jgi:hypothetical protein
MTTQTERERQTRSEVADAAAGVLEARGDESGRRAIEVTLIRPGRSANRLAYSEEVLRASLPLWEGAAAFLDHPDALDLTRAGQRSLRDLVGVYDRVRYEDGVRARLTFYPNAAWAYGLVAAAIADRAAGRPVADIGISADMRVLRRPEADGWAVERITRVVSADLVFQPSAGGAFDRVVEARRQCGEDEMMTGDQSTGRADEVANGPSGERVGPRPGATGAAAAAAGAIGDGPRPAAAEGAPNGRADELMRRLEREVDRVEEARQATCRELLGLKLSASGLPEPARAALRREFDGRIFEADELEARIGALRAMLGEIFGGGVVKHMGATRPEARVGLSALDRVQAALDRLFDLPLPDALASVPRLSGIREAYLALTGDTGFTGRPDRENAVVREANEVTTGVLANALASSMGKRIAMDYAAQPKGSTDTR